MKKYSSEIKHYINEGRGSIDSAKKFVNISNYKGAINSLNSAIISFTNLGIVATNSYNDKALKLSAKLIKKCKHVRYLCFKKMNAVEIEKNQCI